jgi:hypothetical protein
MGQRIPFPHGPWYVVKKDVEKKEVMISKTRVSSMREIFFTDANWFDEPARVTEAQYRYRGPRIAGRIEGSRFVSAQPLPEIPAPGQSLVFYWDGGLVAVVLLPYELQALLGCCGHSRPCPCRKFCTFGTAHARHHSCAATNRDSKHSTRYRARLIQKGSPHNYRIIERAECMHDSNCSSDTFG